jgi:hypothetical protein
MARIRNLDADRSVEQVRRIDSLERATPLEDSSVTRGRVRIASNEGLLVEGSQKVSGVLVVTGTLKVVGRFLLDGITTMTGDLVSSGTALFTGAFTSRGTTRFEGPTTQKGVFHVEGDQDNTGKLDIKGTATVKAGGKIVVDGAQQITLQSVQGTATLQFSDGPRVWSQSGAARMDAGPGAGSVVATAEAAILRSPDTANAVAVSNTGTRIFGDVYLMDLPEISGVTANVRVDPDTGKLSVA